eukprot:TRINITY_DN90646_c0_g1_i1.p1 TRINITY_DN90646_c0_g1~~TRINITY_DN90646_c0_g1_i1.p1  ORF type:complete len:371 (-),score=60.26 TRINITY_DN90646_c0_g1_i1:51-1163(-)
MPAKRLPAVRNASVPAPSQPQSTRQKKRTAKQAVGSSDEERKLKKERHQCIACGCALDSDHSGVICQQSHHICAEGGCAANFVHHIISEGISAIPVTCMMCKAQVVPDTFARNCDPKQLELFDEACIVVGSRAEGESLYRCSYCKVQVSLVDFDCNIIYCCSACQAVYCTVCGQPCSDSDADEHLTQCPSYGELKFAVEKVLADAGVKACPGCGHRGRKDEACTHITCPVCQLRWCYVCGLEREQADGGEASHNAGWRTDPLRCPMYLDSIQDVNTEWPIEPRQAVDHFHRRETCWQLRQLLLQRCKADDKPKFPLWRRLFCKQWCRQQTIVATQNHMEDVLHALLEKFPNVINGFTIAEIVQATPPRDY